jgi:hypothetical protein
MEKRDEILDPVFVVYKNHPISFIKEKYRGKTVKLYCDGETKTYNSLSGIYQMIIVHVEDDTAYAMCINNISDNDDLQQEIDELKETLDEIRRMVG